MEYPFHSNNTNFYSPNYPFYHTHQPMYQGPQSYPKPKPNTSKPKPTISIPVHFISSATKQSDSALKVQAQFRGYLTRKGAKKLFQIKRDVDEIALSISKKETMELIRKESKEKLRVNETLMGLLLKLDTVSGVVLAVKECRKGLIKKVIMLQERVDDIVNGGGDEGEEAEQPVVEYSTDFLEDTDTKECDNNVRGVDVNNGDVDEVEAPIVEPEKTFSMSNTEESGDGADEMCVDACDGETQEQSECQTNEPLTTTEKNNNVTITEPNYVIESQLNGFECESEPRMIEEANTEVKKEPVLVSVENVNMDLEVAKDETMDAMVEEKLNLANRVDDEDMDIQDIPVVSEEIVKVKDSKANREVMLEKVVKENEKLVSVMSKLNERNELQTKLLTELTQRVEDLEKSLKRKKKKQRLYKKDGVFEFW